MQPDTVRTIRAAEVIVDGRDVHHQSSETLGTLEGVVAATLLAVMGGNQKAAAAMLNEGLLQGVEARLALHASRSDRT